MTVGTETDNTVVYRNSVFVNSNGTVLIYNQLNFSDCSFFDPLIHVNRIGRVGSCDNLQKPQFVHQMNAILFKRVEGVVDFEFGADIKGRLLLFNIDDKPKVCFILDDKHISEEVRHKTQIIQIFIFYFLVQILRKDETIILGMFCCSRKREKLEYLAHNRNNCRFCCDSCDSDHMFALLVQKRREYSRHQKNP